MNDELGKLVDDCLGLITEIDYSGNGTRAGFLEEWEMNDIRYIDNSIDYQHVFETKLDKSQIEACEEFVQEILVNNRLKKTLFNEKLAKEINTRHSYFWNYPNWKNIDYQMAVKILFLQVYCTSQTRIHVPERYEMFNLILSDEDFIQGMCKTLMVQTVKNPIFGKFAVHCKRRFTPEVVLAISRQCQKQNFNIQSRIFNDMLGPSINALVREGKL